MAAGSNQFIDICGEGRVILNPQECLHAQLLQKIYRMLVPVHELVGLLSSFAQRSCGYCIHAVYALFWRSTSSASFGHIQYGAVGKHADPLADPLADDRAYHSGSFSNAFVYPAFDRRIWYLQRRQVLLRLCRLWLQEP